MGWYDDVLIHQDGFHGLVIDQHLRGQLADITLKVNLQIFISCPVKQQFFLKINRTGLFSRHSERQVVINMANVS